MAKFSDYGGFAELLPEGTYQGALVGFVEEGFQESAFGGSPQALATFEIAGVTDGDGEPKLVFKRIFNTSTRSRKFKEFVRALSNAHNLSEVDIKDLLGRWCSITCVHTTTADGDTYANIEVSALTGKQPKGAPKKPLKYFSLHPAEFEESMFEGLSERQVAKIKSSRTYRDLTADRLADAGGKRDRRPASEIVGDDIPF